MGDQRNQERRVLLINKEAVEGTYDPPAASDGLTLVEEATFKPDIVHIPRNPHRRTLAPLPGVTGMQMGEFTFTFEKKGEDGVADSVPSWGKLYESAGHLEVVDAGVDVRYIPEDDLDVFASIPTLSCAGNIDGVDRRIRGSRVISIEEAWITGERILVTMTIRGALVGDADSALLLPAFPDTLPEVFGSGTCTVGGFDLGVSEVRITSSLGFVDRKFPSAASGGIKSVALVGRRNWTLEMDPEFTLVAVKDWLAELIGNEVQALILEAGSATGRIQRFEADRLQWTALDDGNRDDLAVAGLTAALVGAPGLEQDDYRHIKK